DDSWFQIAVLTSAADNPLQWFKMTVANTDFSQATPDSKNAFIRRIGSIIGARQELAEIKSVFEFSVKAGVTETDEWGLAALEGLARGLELAGGELKADAALQRRLLGVLREENSRFAEKVLLVGQQLRLERTAQ